MDWVTQKVHMSCCPPSCGKQVTSSRLDAPIEPGDAIRVAFLLSESEEFIRVTTTPSQCLAQEAMLEKESEQKLQFEKTLPKCYQDFKDVFSKDAFAHLPSRKPWDHAIKLIPEA